MTQHLTHRPRRLRRTPALRKLVRENHLRPADFIYPVFLLPDNNQAQPVAAMPGVQRLSLDRLYHQAERCLELGVPVMALFPVIPPELKTPDGAQASNPEGLLPHAVQQLKARFQNWHCLPMSH